MAVVKTEKSSLVLRFWQASLAWRIGGEWAKGWTQESFIEEIRTICFANDNLGAMADRLLDDMIHAREHNPRGTSAEVVELHSRHIPLPIVLGHQVMALETTA